jgi:hypothetical protein
MKKFSFTFPTYEALWQFKDQSKAINISIIPKQHTITGLFCNEEADLAVKQFHAVSNYDETARLARTAC